jgi:hypothetical protein
VNPLRNLKPGFIVETDFYGENVRDVTHVKPFEIDPLARQALVLFESELGRLPQVKLTVKHYFAEGLYCRQMFIPKGCALVGYIHRQDCISVVAKGLLVISDGARSTILKPPMVMAVPKGSKKAGYAMEDSVFIDVYVITDGERDIDKLEARLTADTHEDYLRLENEK